MKRLLSIFSIIIILINPALSQTPSKGYLPIPQLIKLWGMDISKFELSMRDLHWKFQNFTPPADTAYSSLTFVFNNLLYLSGMYDKDDIEKNKIVLAFREDSIYSKYLKELNKIAIPTTTAFDEEGEHWKSMIKVFMLDGKCIKLSTTSYDTDFFQYSVSIHGPSNRDENIKIASMKHQK